MSSSTNIGKERQGAAAVQGLDGVSRAMLYQGCSVSQLAELFQYDNRTVAKKINGIMPCGSRRGFPVYAIRDVAPYLVTPAGDIEEHIKKMNPDDLPPQLNQRFWAGLRERSKYQEEQGDSWRSSDVIEHFSGVFKSLRIELGLLTDRLRRETQLSERQREILQSEIDATLEKIRVALTEQYTAPEGDTSGEGEGEDDFEDIRVARDDEEDLSEFDIVT